MKLNKILSIFLVTVLTISSSCINVFAEEQTLCEKVGIGDLSSHKVIMSDGNEYADSPTLIANTQIINLGSSIGAYSSPHSTYRITGDSLCAAILGTDTLNYDSEAVLTSEGYSLHYIGPSGSEEKNQTVEAGGYIRATKEQEIIDIPIVDKTTLKTYDGNQIGVDWQNNGGTGVHRGVNSSDLAGKASDDTIFWFSVGAGAVVNTARAHNHNIDTLNTPGTVITVEFAMRVTGDVVAVVENNNQGYQLMKFNSDGTFSYRCHDKNAMIDVKACSDGSLWHNVALVYDYAGNRVIYYFDGQRLPELGRITTDELTGLRFIVANGTYTQGGTAEFDNLRISRGFYKPYEPASLTSVSSDVTVENDTVLYDAEKLKDISMLTTTLETDADRITVYKDKTLREVSETLDDGNMLVLYSEETDAYSYYELKSLQVTVKSVDFVKDGGKVSCRAELEYPGADGTDVTLVMALVGADGRVVRLTSSPVTTVAGSSILETPAIDGEELAPKAFFINNWVLREGISSTIFEEE